MTETAQERPTFDAFGRLRPAKNVQPGWHVWTTDGWFEVSLYAHIDNIVTGQKVARFVFADNTTMDAIRSADVMCRTAAEAKRAAKAETANSTGGTR